jgi:hypothetical protein
MKKGLAIAIILLFVTITFSSSINARNNTVSTKMVSSEKEISITILDYRPDGTVAKSILKMPQEQLEKFQEELDGVKDLDTRLSIYKKFNLIPQNVTSDTIRDGVDEKAQRMRLSQNKLDYMIKNNQTLFNKHQYINVFCSVHGVGDVMVHGLYLMIPFGTSLITFFYNFLNWGPYLKSFDILDFIIGDLYFRSVGEFGLHWSEGSFHGVIKMVGFVGYVYSYWGRHMDFIEVFDGFTAYVRAIGTFS